jgi:hypothetical protein
MYHYEANVILAKPMSGLDDISIFQHIQIAIQGPDLKRVQAKNKHHGQPSNQAHQSILHGTTVQVTTS